MRVLSVRGSLRSIGSAVYARSRRVFTLYLVVTPSLPCCGAQPRAASWVLVVVLPMPRATQGVARTAERQTTAHRRAV
jgi:hypothetical protein